MQDRLDVVVANAGICVPKPWVDRTQPTDVPDTVLFLASGESRYITAHELAPDAGVTEF
jgi:NAD(P)-dependent dehydrogenase (short-subunit alcohol dehydrogenase family)